MNNKGETIISDGTGGNDTFENTHHTFDDIRQVNRVKFTVKNEFLSSWVDQLVDYQKEVDEIARETETIRWERFNHQLKLANQDVKPLVDSKRRKSAMIKLH